MPEKIEKISSAPTKEKLQESLDAQVDNSPTLSAAVDTLGVEGAGIETGEVSEVLSENKEQKGDSPNQSTAKKVDPKARRAQVTAKLLKKAPKPAQMRQEIKKEIEAEIKYLRKKALKMVIAPGKVNYYEMNNLIKKIRELKGLLRTLAKATLENIKTLWLRFVHGIM